MISSLSVCEEDIFDVFGGTRGGWALHSWQDNSVTAILFYAPWCFYSQQAGVASDSLVLVVRGGSSTRPSQPLDILAPHLGVLWAVRLLVSPKAQLELRALTDSAV